MISEDFFFFAILRTAIADFAMPTASRLCFLLLMALCPLRSLPGQNTVGLLSYVPDKSYAGYNLLFPHGQSTVWLLNDCGEVVHRWDDTRNRVPGNAVYLQPNGDLLVCYNRPGSAGDPIWAGGGGQYVELRSWTNEILWTYELNTEFARLHHDVTMLPNGHVLMIAWESKTPEEAIAAGRDTALITEGAVWPDYILEYAPELDSVVWTWRAWDHVIQDHDPLQANFGIITNHPERIDINHVYVSGQADWMHANAIDYNPELDLIMLSVPHFDEIWFIDHSTTLAESASHEGGLWGRGGDLVYRWGNPRAYGRGDSTDQQVFFGHDCHWLDDFEDPADPRFGGVAFFNNRVGTNRSRADIILPVIDTLNYTFEMIGNVWGPAFPVDTFQHPVDPARMYSSGLSSLQLLPNGNTLILVGRSGYAFEMTPEQQIVWEFIVPIRNGMFIPQGEIASNNTTFRMKRYPQAYSAFHEKDLTRIGYMELNPDSTFCNRLVAAHQPDSVRRITTYPNPARGDLFIESVKSGSAFTLSDSSGRRVREGRFSETPGHITLQGLLPGWYVLRVEGFAPQVIVKGE